MRITTGYSGKYKWITVHEITYEEKQQLLAVMSAMDTRGFYPWYLVENSIIQLGGFIEDIEPFRFKALQRNLDNYNLLDALLNQLRPRRQNE